MGTVRLACESDPDAWFPEKGDTLGILRAKGLCHQCPLVSSCRAHAREQGIPEGVWGGESEKERALYWRSIGGQPTAFMDGIATAHEELRQMSSARKSQERAAELPDEWAS